VLDEDDRDFKRTRKPVEETEEKPILIINRDYHSSHKAKKRRIEADHDSGTRIKLSKDDTSEDVKTEVKFKIKEEESSRTEDDERKKDEDASKKKDDEQSVEHDRSEKKREISSGNYCKGTQLHSRTLMKQTASRQALEYRSENRLKKYSMTLSLDRIYVLLYVR
jgi:hypothetical protein